MYVKNIIFFKNIIQTAYICAMAGEVGSVTFETSRDYYIWMLKYYALCLNKKAPSGRDLEFLLGLICAKHFNIKSNTRNRVFTEYFSKLNWHHSNIHTYRDRCLIAKWIHIEKDGTFDFLPETTIPDPQNDGFTFHFKIKVIDTTIKASPL